MSQSRLKLLFSVVICLLFFALPVSADDITHTVEPGENLFRIALHYGVSVDVLAQVNGISDVRVIYVGQVLTIPDPANTPTQDMSQPVVENSLVAGDAVYHTVQRGELLFGIARQYGLTWQELANLNGITNPNVIYAGQQLTIIQPATTASGTALSTTIVDASASVPDTASSTTAVDAPPAVPDTVSDVPAVADTTPATTETTPTPEAVTTTHVVQPGEWLSSIARQYGVDWTSIARANNISDPNTLYAGQVLIIPGAGSTGDLGIIEPTIPSAVTGGRSIVVDLSDQRIYAYEDGVLVRNVLASTGLWGTPTVQGDFTIYVKYAAQTMVGPGYYLPDVPWVMYFYQGYGIHGTYWHNNFGHPMGHGCVNLPTPEAEWFYNWASVGTPVHVQA